MNLFIGKYETCAIFRHNVTKKVSGHTKTTLGCISTKTMRK